MRPSIKSLAESPIFLMALICVLSVMEVAVIVSTYDMYARAKTENEMAYFGAQKYREGFNAFHKPAAIAAPAVHVVKRVAVSRPVWRSVHRMKVETDRMIDIDELLATIDQ